MQRNVLISIIAVLLAAGGVLSYFVITQQEEVTVAPLEREEAGLGGELFEKSGNPAQKVPETNPFKEVQTNPLEGTNPFEGAFVNPFGE